MCKSTDEVGDAEAIIVHGAAAYIAGGFQSVNGVDRSFYAAAAVKTGRLLPWNPNANSTFSHSVLHSLSPTASALVTSADFSRIGGSSRDAVAGLDYISGRATRLRVHQKPCVPNRKDFVVGYGQIYLSIKSGPTTCALAAFDSGTGQQIQWAPASAPLTDEWDLPFAAIAHTIYVMRLNTDEIGFIGVPIDPSEPWHALERVDATSGRPVSSSQPSFNNEIKAVAPAGADVLVGGDFTAVRFGKNP